MRVNRQFKVSFFGLGWNPRFSIGGIAALATIGAVFGIGCDSARRGTRGSPSDGSSAAETPASERLLDPDGDRITEAAGDCAPLDRDVFPGAAERCNGKDDNCDGRVDEGCDADGDGYSTEAGDCDDSERLVNPGAFEASGNRVDDDCDGSVDEANPSCEQPLPGDAAEFAAAMELCGPWLRAAEWGAEGDPRARAVVPFYGNTLRPRRGGQMLALSTGMADPREPGWTLPQPGTSLGRFAPSPFKLDAQNRNVCGGLLADPDDVLDPVELNLTLQAPTNARSLSFRFYFMSAEYPEWVGSEFNDKFLAVVHSKAVGGGKPTNVTFDARKNPITVNVGFFSVCESAPICNGSRKNACGRSVADLAGSGFEADDGLGPAGGGTGWLTTTVPVEPGETLTLRFALFDEGDDVLDSVVLLDDFEWQITPAESGPVTIQ